MSRRDLVRRCFAILPLAGLFLARRSRAASVDEFHKAHDRFADAHNAWAREAASISPASPDYNERVIGKFLELSRAWRRVEEIAVEIVRKHA